MLSLDFYISNLTKLAKIFAKSGFGIKTEYISELITR